MKPVVTDTISGYVFFWPDLGISITASRIHVHSRDSHVSGEIQAQAVNDDNKPLIIYPASSFNFSAPRTRKELAGILATKNPEPPWADMVDQLCFGVQERARKGEPVIELDTIGDVQPPEYMLYPLIVQHYPNVLFGDPSSSKSTLAVIVAQVVSLPWWNNPMGLIAPERSMKVLYLDWETDADTIRWQTTMLQRGIEGMEILFLNYRQCSQPLAQDVEQIKQHIADTRADLIIIDSLGLAAGGELKETQPALSFYAALRSLRTTSLILAHNSKDRDTQSRSIYGNQFFTAQARNVWELRKDQEPDSNELDIALFHRKPPPFAGMHKPLGFRLIYDNKSGKLAVTHSDPKTVGEFLAQMGWKERIYDALKQGPLTNKDLCEILETNSANVSTNLARMEKQGLVSKQGNTWGLIERRLDY